MKVSGKASAKKSFQKDVGWPEGSRAGDTRREWMGTRAGDPPLRLRVWREPVRTLGK